MARIETVERLREIITEYGPRGAAKIRDHVCPQGLEFISRSPFLMLSTLGQYGLGISQKGGEPGFVKIEDNKTLLIPEHAGNHLAIGLQNILHDPQVALAFIRPATDEVLRVSGHATLLDDQGVCAALSADNKSAKLIIRVTVYRAAFHCVRSSRRARLWDPASWDKPSRISFGKIYADALSQPELQPVFDKLAEESDANLY